MRIVRILVGVLVLGGVIGAGLLFVNREKVYADDLDKEAQAQKAEVLACKDRLGVLNKALSAYKRDHKGGLPGAYEDLYPKYVPDASLYVCPTAARWLTKRGIGKGQVTLGGKEYPATYGFVFLTSGYHLSQKRLGDEAPLIVCESHREALYQCAYRRAPSMGAFSPESIGGLAGPVRNAPVPTVRQNGTVDSQRAEEP